MPDSQPGWIVVRALLAGILLALLAGGLGSIAPPPPSWRSMAAAGVFGITVLLVEHAMVRRWRPARTALLSLVIALCAGAVAFFSQSFVTAAAWISLAASFVLLFAVDDVLSHDGILGWVTHGTIALIAGTVPVIVTQLHAQFADEEFFVALQIMIVSFIWLLLLLVRGSRQPAAQVTRRARFGLWALIVIGGAVGGATTVYAYQQSFYRPTAPEFPGISEENPFLCGTVPTVPRDIDGDAIFRRLIDAIADDPDKHVTTYGMLALTTGTREWAEAFRTELLAEARANRFAGPANSVKWTQHLAAFRVYYFDRIRTEFPTLFSPDEVAVIREWFSAINQRALTAEWVDLMYALAFSKWPEGPYENQETGAGLLALLESTGMAPPALSLTNETYLEQNPGGWALRFRNTDDAFIYQIEWLTNALYQAHYTGTIDTHHQARSFEWMLLQALPNGAMPAYNHPSSPSLAAIAYLGASLLEDPRYLWLADAALSHAERHDTPIPMQPGVKQAVDLTGRTPDAGSCLLYGDSGLPNQIGPLAPDKIVFRDGWSRNDAYLLLNLRFTGWHRYKATNAIVMLHKGSTVLTELTRGRQFHWLPEGRSLFRDKRIPRENLNGLLVAKTSFVSVLRTLTGIGSPWAQDPPQYAEPVSFATGSDQDSSHTRLTDWHGWTHDRWIHFFHDNGPIVIRDYVHGAAGPRTALSWHLAHVTQEPEIDERLRGRAGSMDFVVIPLSSNELSFSTTLEGDSGLGIQYNSAAGDEIHAAAVFLPTPWHDADVDVISVGGEQQLRIRNDDRQVTVPLQTQPE